MATGKKSFIAYSDWHGMFKALPDEVAGKLIKHVFSYVNDESPQCEDYVINALFEQIKASLKRDLEKWEKQREQRSQAGKRSAKLRSTKSNDRSTTVNETERKATVSVNDSVSVSVNVNDISLKKKQKEIKKKKEGDSFKVVYPFDSVQFLDWWGNWKKYKKDEHKFQYKSGASEQAALKKLSELSEGNEQNAILIIEQSLANGWKGFFKLEKNETNKRTNSTGADPDELAELYAAKFAKFNQGK